MNKITTIILSKNEENNIERAIRSALAFSNILVVDDYSTDKTVSIARKLGATVLQRKLSDNFAQQRNYALKNIDTDWALFLDADEAIPVALRKMMRKAVARENIDGYYIPRQDIWKGRKLAYGEWGNMYLLRLAKVGKGLWQNKVHEVWNIKGNTLKLNTPILHYPHQTIYAFISHINYHARLHASQKATSIGKSSILKVVLYPILKFGYNFALKKGYRDGIYGFIYSIIMSFHSFLAWSTFYLTSNEKKN